MLLFSDVVYIVRCSELRYFEIKREQRAIGSNNAGSFYNIVNSKLACNKDIDDVRGNTVIDDKQLVNMLNEYFSSMCTVDDVFASPIANDAPLNGITFTSAKVAGILAKTEGV